MTCLTALNTMSPAYTLVTHMQDNRSPMPQFHAFWNCGWTVGRLAACGTYTILRSGLTHRQFNHKYKRLTSRKAHHTGSPEILEKQPEWRRVVDNIYFTHPLHGQVVSRLNDGVTAILRDPKDDSFVERVPYSDLTEVPRFEVCKQPRTSYLTSPKTSSPRTRKRKLPVKQEMTQQQFESMDGLMDWELLNIEPVII